MTAISLEFFPPKTDEQRDTLAKSVTKLLPLRPEYVSVTFGAGGSTLTYTHDTVATLQREHGLDVAPHISCMGGTRAEIKALLDSYIAMDIKRLVALRGDMPSGMAAFGEFHYASDLVEFIRHETGDYFHIEVAAYPEFHPQSESAKTDLQYFKRKIDAGANGAITQYFYTPDAYFRFVEDVRNLGVNVPIVAGIMPISNYSQLRRFSEMCGAEIPRWMAKRLHALGDDADSIREFGAEMVADLCYKLIGGGAPAIHFYTLNRARATLAICERLGLSST